VVGSRGPTARPRGQPTVGGRPTAVAQGGWTP
jgi:hypothetical protein